MTKTRTDRFFGPGRKASRRAVLVLMSATAPTASGHAQTLDFDLGNLGVAPGQVVLTAITVGIALAALGAFAAFMRSRRDDRLSAAQAELRSMRASLDRTEALLDADDQRTIVWDSAVAEPRIFGGLPERAGAPTDKKQFLGFEAWLLPESAAELEAAADKLRRQGVGFQIVVRTIAGTLLEATGRTSGRRAALRIRELTGERRSFAELKEQAVYVINEMAALRALADIVPIPLWRRNRSGRLTWVNAAYVRAVEAASHEAVLNAGIELLPTRTRDAIRDVERSGKTYSDSATAIVAGDRRRLQVLDKPIDDGTIGCALDVSEVDSVREDLTRAAQWNTRLLDQLTAGVAAFDHAGRLLFHNAAFRALWGLPADWLASAPEESALLDRLRSERKLPEQANYRDWRSRHLAAYRGGEPREEMWHLPDSRTLRMVAIPVSDGGGMTYIFENVTQQITLESRLKSISQLQGETLDHLAEAVAVFGTDGKLRLFNPVFAEIWRLSPTQLRNEPHIGEIIATCQAIYSGKTAWDEIRAAVTNFDHQAQAAGRMERPDRSVIDYATVALPEGMTMLTFVDVTDSARVERALKERNEALEAADRLKSEFIQHVSYELRSPLQTIIGFSELLAQQAGGLNPPQREYLDHIDSSSRELLALINDILDLATVDAGIMSLDIGEADITSVAQAAVEGLRDRLGEQNLSLDISIPTDIGSFHVDAQRVRQILFNLVANAIRFSNAGGNVRLAAVRQGKNIVFTVTDEGVGIPKDVMPKIFRPFEAHAPQGFRGGAGLGLSIVKSLVELHGGSIDIRSAEGEGTTATVRIPVVPAAVAVAAE